MSSLFSRTEAAAAQGTWPRLLVRPLRSQFLLILEEAGTGFVLRISTSALLGPRFPLCSHCSNSLLDTGAGADFVMLGGMLAGHTESGGELIEKGGKKYRLFYGMSSEVAMKKYAGGVAEYRYCGNEMVKP